MKAIKHSSSNGSLRCPQNAPYGVPTYSVPLTTKADNNGTAMTTFWEPSEEDIANILAGGIVELTVYGPVHPMIQMKVAMP